MKNDHKLYHLFITFAAADPDCERSQGADPVLCVSLEIDVPCVSFLK